MSIKRRNYYLSKKKGNYHYEEIRRYYFDC